jgi:hypothetical protein
MRAAVLPALALTLVLLPACGSDGTTAGTDPGTDAPAATDLTVTVDRGDGSEATEYTLTCGPPGGTHPAPQAACDLLAAAASLDPNPLEPVPPDVACTEIYGGPQTATVTGTIDGEQVDTTFDRVNGCEIARWDAALPLLVEPGGV